MRDIVESAKKAVSPERLSLLKRLFPMPPLAALREHTGDSLPFECFGAMGGYGWFRGELVQAIHADDAGRAEPFYYALVHEAVEEGIFLSREWVADGTYKRELTYAESALVLATNVDPFGHLRPDDEVVNDLGDIIPDLG